MIKSKINFIQASTQHGPMILCRNDYKIKDGGTEFGVGLHLLHFGEYDMPTINMSIGILKNLYEKRGGPIMALDIGANLGVYSLEWGRVLDGFGEVHAFEPQECIFYALCGNIVLNNLSNVKASMVVVSDDNEHEPFPEPDYSEAANYGGLGVDYACNDYVKSVVIDDLNYQRLDMMKIDVEGYELKVLEGAQKTIKRCRPVIIAEWIKVGVEAIAELLPDYRIVKIGMNVFCDPLEDPMFQIEDKQ